MKILMLTPYLPFPPSSGGQIRSFNLLKHLSKDHEITLISLIKDEKERKHIKELSKFCKSVKVFKRTASPWTLRNILLTGFGPYPFLVIRNLSPDEKKGVEAELKKEKYDLIHAETFYVMPHIPKTDIPVLLVEQTIEYLVYKHFVEKQAKAYLRPLLNIDVSKLRYWERVYWKKADKVVAVSEADKEAMLNLVPDLDVGIVPNGVNLDFFKVKKSWKNNDPKILFVANFKWLQNVEAAVNLLDEVYPIVHKELKNAKLWIVGQHIPDTLKDRKSESIIIDDLAENDEESIQKAYYESSVFVSPLKGPGGTRLKHFAAMASKLPLVTTSVGAEGLSVKNGENIIVRNNMNDIAKATISILKDSNKAMKIANSARKLVEEKYSWEKMAISLNNIYKELGKIKK